MYTRCGECRTLFRVTREQLNAARGQVRCGHCGVVFDALASLREEIALDDSQPDIMFEPSPAAEPEAEVEAIPAATDAYMEELFAPPRTRGRRWPWITAGVFLVFALGVQAAHMQRERLLDHGLIGPYLSMVYDYLDFDVGRDPPHDLRAFVLLHHELVTHARNEDALHLSGVLYNAADIAQSWPILELRLEDRFGDMVAARRLQPSEYLRNAPDQGGPMPAGARRAIEIAFVDPGADAVGFSIDFCLMLNDGLRCAGQPELP